MISTTPSLGFPWKKIARGLGEVAGIAGGPAGAAGKRVLFHFLGGDGDEDAELLAESVDFVLALESDTQFDNAQRKSALMARIRADRPDWKERQVETYALLALLEAKGDFEQDPADASA